MTFHMNDTATLQRTIRSCTALLVVTISLGVLISAWGAEPLVLPVLVLLAGALLYLLARAVLILADWNRTGTADDGATTDLADR